MEKKIYKQGDHITLSVPTYYGNVDMKFEIIKEVEPHVYLLYAQKRLMRGIHFGESFHVSPIIDVTSLVSEEYCNIVN